MEFRYQKMDKDAIFVVDEFLDRYDYVTFHYPTLKALAMDHPEMHNESFQRRLSALIEYSKTWNYAQVAKEKLEFLQAFGPPYYNPNGSVEENITFFSRYVVDEKLQTIFRYNLYCID